MKKKYNFEMGKLLDLYKNDIDKGREYLHENLSVFSGGKTILNIGYAARDIYQDIYMVIDRCIIKSIKDGFDEKQIYKYIKTRVRGELINRKGKSGVEVSNHLLPDEICYEKDSLDILDDDYTYKLISDIVMKLDEPQKTIMILYHMTTPRRSFKQIGLTIGISEQQVLSEYNKAIKFIRDTLENENIN